MSAGDTIFVARVIETIDNSPNGWEYLRIGVFEQRDGHERQVGEYVRNYFALTRTFCHFRKDGRDLALYSPHYTATRIMALPSCADIGGEEPNAYGFCPAEYYVPSHHPMQADRSLPPVGFIAGCIWGDDSSKKIQFLDLSQADRGILKRDERFGYIQLPEKCTLEQAVSMHVYYPDYEHPCVAIGIQVEFKLDTGKRCADDP